MLAIYRRLFLLAALLLLAGVTLWQESLPAERIIVRPRLDTARVKMRGGIPQRDIRRPKVGLVFSGGGARGIAQVGVLKALERHKIPVDFIASTSIGSIVGGLYASGWTSSEIESLTTHIDWDEVTSLSEDTRRTDLFVDQRLAGERSFLTVRFEGFEPVIPSSVSRGQRLTNLLHLLTLQSIYHPSPSFDDLDIAFRAVATDLVSGKRIVLDRGSLAEALRASSTVPLLFSPIEKDSMRLVDGGLVDNIPVDVAEDAGCDIIIAVNSTSGLRTLDEMKAPWEIADQIMGIMMLRVKQEQLRRADIVITPAIGDHLSSDFHGLDSLIRTGEESTDAQIPAILRLYDERKNQFDGVSQFPAARTFPGIRVNFSGAVISDSIKNHILSDAADHPVSLQDIQEHVNMIYEEGIYENVYASVEPEGAAPAIEFHCEENPAIQSFQVTGCSVIPATEIVQEFISLTGSPFNSRTLQDAIENALRKYRKRGYSLARVDSVRFDRQTGRIAVALNEGMIRSIHVEGGIRTQDSYVLSEFPLRDGDVFEIEKARKGLTNINSSSLFEFVYLEVTYEQNQPVLTIRLRERPSQLLRLGLRADNERKFQASLDIRDENFRGTATELGLTILGGERNADVVLEYKARKLFGTYLTFGASAFYRSRDNHLFGDAPPPGENRWDRQQIGDYREVSAGGGITFGTQLERLGTATVDLFHERARVQDISGAQALVEDVDITLVRVGTILDTKDRNHFATSGIVLRLSYEFALQSLGGSVGYNAFRGSYESFSAISRRVTFHPRVQFGFADNTMPLTQQFRMGGRESFVGLREDDRRGRQILLLSGEFRWFLPVRLFFDTYLRLRYDLGTISAVPEELKLKTFLHAVGAELALDTPIGPAIFGAGKAFYFARNLPENPIQQGPLLLYFVVGYQL
jgi:NTE family protein